ncbi:MAG: J domain-containing protein [Myxococcales bacterium]|nr:J domain-containing protein [Myxococcales bacterium]
MTNRDPAFDNYVLKIHAVLERLDYYRLLGVAPDATVGDVKKAFLSITTRFHPDRNRNADKAVQKAIYDIFKRLNEAYRVLCDAEKRKLYDADLKMGTVRFRTDVRMSMIPKTPEDTIRSKEARQFYLSALKSLETNNIMQADLHIRMAAGREPNNEAIKALIATINDAKQAKK